MADIKLLGSQRELFPKHQFLVKVENGWDAGFSTCSELSYEIAKIEYYEGGSIIPWKVPGRVSVTDVTLERGASTSKLFYNWAISTANATVGGKPTRGRGTLTPYYTKDIKIIQLDRDGVVANAKRKWRLRNAWIQKFIAGDWDNNSDEVVIESLTLTFDFFRLEQ